jgi:hypothetical protein
LNAQFLIAGIAIFDLKREWQKRFFYLGNEKKNNPRKIVFLERQPAIDRENSCSLTHDGKYLYY